MPKYYVYREASMSGEGVSGGMPPAERPYDRYFRKVSQILLKKYGIDVQDYGITIDDWRKLHAMAQRGVSVNKFMRQVKDPILRILHI